MQDSGGLLGALGAVAFVALLILAILSVLMPVMVYAVQKWAHRSYLELRKANASLDAIAEAVQAQWRVLSEIAGGGTTPASRTARLPSEEPATPEAAATPAEATGPIAALGRAG